MYSVRFAATEDIPALILLLTELFTQEVDFSPDVERQRRGVERILSNPSVGRIFVCERDAQVVGMVSLLFTVSTAEGGPAAWLEDMVVSSGHRNRGIGEALLEHALRFAKTEGLSRITLLTDRTNERAQRFYARHGFEHSGMVPMRISLSRISGSCSRSGEE
ncbi:MAG: GNAT family N-acetyltransferase [bacterium]|nr:GNAT family N-acetyltransferase [bacterium]